MNHILLIARKDLRSYFQSPIAYIVISVFVLLMGWMFFNLLSYYSQQVGQYAAMSFGAKPTLSDSVIRPLFSNMNVLLLFVAPFITMRLIAEERKDHTIELLLTAPLKPFAIVLGKFFAAVALLLILLATTLAFPLTLATMARPDWGVIVAGYVGMILISCTYVSVGLFWSSRTENQIVAAILSFGTLLFFWLISWSAHRAGPIWSEILTGLSVIGHFSSFAQGVIDTQDIVFYFSFIGFGLFLTHLSFDTNNWS